MSACEKGSVEVADKAPDFSLRDMQGKLINLVSLKGKVVLVDFWATWCPPCKMSIPDLNALNEKYSQKGFVLIAVSVDSDIGNLKPFIKETKIQYPVYFDDKDVNRLYKVRSIPTAFLIDKQGKIADKHYGYSSDFLPKISTKIESLL